MDSIELSPIEIVGEFGQGIVFISTVFAFATRGSDHWVPPIPPTFL